MMSRKPSTRRSRVSRIAALVCAAALTLTGCDFSVYSLPLPGGADLGDDPYSVRVKFRDVLDLVPKSAVKVDDVTVGRVDEIKLDGFTADVTVLVRGDVELPDNTMAEIRQTSLLGEKFVSLKSPDTGASANRLADGDVIPLDRSGRNAEVEEVLGAMSLLLNGGGVAQLKTISSELNKALGGREGDVKSVFQQLDVFMAQLDENKEDIVEAIESLNQLAISINAQRSSIELALDEMPEALASLDRQRDDLVKMLDALSQLSSVGTRVIRDSKAGTIESLESLDPILTKLAEAGDAFPKAFQVFLTYPFVDEVVGRNPVQARNLHMGDFTNLSVQMDLDLRGDAPTIPGLPGQPDLPIDPIKELTDVQECLQNPGGKACNDLTKKQKNRLCNLDPGNPICAQLPDDGVDPLPGLPDLGGGGDVSCGIPLLCRTSLGFNLTDTDRGVVVPTEPGSARELGYDATLGALLIQGMVQR